jgi:hypothetical protein
VVCCATGTKCTAQYNGHGDILHDCHAKVFVLWGFMNVLVHELEQQLLLCVVLLGDHVTQDTTKTESHLKHLSHIPISNNNTTANSTSSTTVIIAKLA